MKHVVQPKKKNSISSFFPCLHCINILLRAFLCYHLLLHSYELFKNTFPLKSKTILREILTKFHFRIRMSLKKESFIAVMCNWCLHCDCLQNCKWLSMQSIFWGPRHELAKNVNYLVNAWEPETCGLSCSHNTIVSAMVFL